MAKIQELVFIKACTNAGVDPEEFEESRSTKTSFFPDLEKTQQQGIDWAELSQLFDKGDLEESDFRRFENVEFPDFSPDSEEFMPKFVSENAIEAKNKEEPAKPPPEMADEFDMVGQIAKTVDQKDKVMSHQDESDQIDKPEEKKGNIDYTHKHYFSGLPVLKKIDFNDKDHISKFQVRNAMNSAEYFRQTATKLQVMLEEYTPADFDKVKFYRLNGDQILTFLTSPNFAQNAPIKKVIESFVHLYKSRSLSLYDRPEIMDLLKPIVTNHEYLEEAPPSYVTSLAYTTMRMRIEDDEIWFSFAEYLMKHYEEMSLRDIGQFLLALHHASKNAPITVDFSDEFTHLELPIIQKFEESEDCDLQSLTQILTAYSKGYLGSVEFYTAMEKYILEYIYEHSKDLDTPGRKKKTCMIELANIIYSFAMTDYVSNEIIKDLLPVLEALLPTIKRREVPSLVISMKALCKSGLFKGQIVEEFEKAFAANHEYMTANDLSDFYYYFVSAEMRRIKEAKEDTPGLVIAEGDDRPIGSPRFYNCLQKCISKLVKTFTMQDLLKMFYMYETEYNRLYTGKSRTSIREKLKIQARYLFSQDKKYGNLNQENLKELKRLSQPNKPESLKIYQEVLEGKRDPSDWFKAAREISRKR